MVLTHHDLNISGQEECVHVDVQVDVTQVSDSEQFGMQCSLQREQQQSDSGIHNPCHCYTFYEYMYVSLFPLFLYELLFLFCFFSYCFILYYFIIITY